MKKGLITNAILKIKRFYKSINKPFIHKEFDTTLSLYGNEDAKESALKVRISGEGKIKLLDIVVILGILTAIFSIICGIFSIINKFSK